MTHECETAADLIQQRAGREPIGTAVLLGTGLSHVVDSLEEAVEVPYGDLPGFPRLTISGHEAKLVIGRHEGVRTAFLLGRAHYYECGDARAMASALETLALVGAQTLLLTNAAGSVNSDLSPGTLAMITDHINFSGLNPLVGVAADGGFVSMTEAYDKRLQRRLKRAAVAAGITLRQGVYMWFSGPSFETPAEIRMARLLGADLVGMSTVPEVILARRLALRVAAVSVVTNFGAGFNHGNPNHAETKEVALHGALGLRRLIRAFLTAKDENWAALNSGEGS